MKWVFADLHRLPERSSGRLQPVADLPEFLRRGIDALLLRIRAFLLSFGSEAQRVQLPFHLFHCPGETRQLRRNARYIFFGGRSSPILGLNS
jgi:hypothetical protein